MPDGTDDHSGWLYKRYPVFQSYWQRRWCILRAKSFLYYKDETCKVAHGRVNLHPNTTIVRFNDELAPAACNQLSTSRPFGFMLDVNPARGDQRQLLYFDACDAEVLNLWVLALLRAVHNVAELVRSVSSDSSEIMVGQRSISSASTRCSSTASPLGGTCGERTFGDWQTPDNGRASEKEALQRNTLAPGTPSTTDSPTPSMYFDLTEDDAVGLRYCNVGVSDDTLESPQQTAAVAEPRRTYLYRRQPSRADVAVGPDDPMDPDGSDITESGSDAFRDGDRVCLVGLVSETGCQLNGQCGIALGFVSSKMRWQVRLDGSREVKLVKPTNLLKSTAAEFDTSIVCLSSSFLHPTEVSHFVGDGACIICLELFKGSAITITRCGHVFHTRCLNRSAGHACPQCRQSIDDPSVEPLPEPQP